MNIVAAVSPAAREIAEVTQAAGIISKGEAQP